jgi:6-phosphofructokinase 1
METFFSYTQVMSELVQRVRRAALSSLGEIFIYEGEPSNDAHFLSHINGPLMRSQTLVVFIGDELGDWQSRHEIPQFWTLANNEPSEKGNMPCRILYAVLCSPERLKEHLIKGKLAGYDGCNRVFASSPDILKELNKLDDSGKQALLDKEAMFLAKALVKEMRQPWRFIDGLPANPHLFDYEKTIIDHFADARRLFPNGNISRNGCLELANPEDKALAKRIYERWLDGCPVEWPKVKDRGGRYENRFTEEKGAAPFRQRDHYVLVKALIREEVSPDLWLTIPEAGPRKLLHFAPDQPLRVGIMVSGGIAPGINAVIDGIVHRHSDYAKAHGCVLNVYGFQDGFLAFKGGGHKELVSDQGASHGSNVVVTSDHAHQGGSVIGTSRVDGLLEAGDRIEQLEDCDKQLEGLNIDILYVIGGDGTMKAAHALHEVSLKRREARGGQKWRRRLSVVAIPKTMDNDVLWVWQSFGFLSAVEKAREIIEHLSTEVESNPRVCIVQLFGSDSGFVVSHAVLASATGHCVLALIPEVEFSMSGVIKYLRERIWPKDQRPARGIIVMAETAIPTDAEDFVNHDYVGLTPEEKKAILDYLDLRKQKRRIQGQTDDALRSAGLKIVKNVLACHLAPSDGANEKSPSGERSTSNPDWSLLRVVTNEPRHLLRAIPPSCLDIIFGQRLGTLAVDNALAGYTDFMISQWLTEYVLVPLQLVVLGRKRIPRTGIFWKSILAKTGQPADLDIRGSLRPLNDFEQA